MPATPEQTARRKIDADLAAAGWLVQDRNDIDLTAGRGIAVREFAMKQGFGSADYLLYLDRKAVGAVEAKGAGTLAGVEAQSAKYTAGLPDNLPAHGRPLPFLFESNGSVTYFTNGLDPAPRSRQVFNFLRPETFAEWVVKPAQLRARLKTLPELDDAGLWNVQARAIRNLEQSFGRADPRALIKMATGWGKHLPRLMSLIACSNSPTLSAFSFSLIAAIWGARLKMSSPISSRPTTHGNFRRSIPSSGSGRTP